MDTGLLLLRLVVGLLLVGHGAQKLFGWFGGDLTETSASFRLIGYWPPRLMAGFAGLAEILAGIGLTVGFLTPLVAAIIIGTMLNAAVAAHGRNGLWAVDNGYEYPLVLATVGATVAFTGPGTVSLDTWLGPGDPTIESAVFAVALGLVIGLAVLASRIAVRSALDPTAEPDVHDLAA